MGHPWGNGIEKVKETTVNGDDKIRVTAMGSVSACVSREVAVYKGSSSPMVPAVRRTDAQV